jgi:trimeric autotransporter adhesin
MHRLMIPIFLFLWSIQICFGQVGIGTANPNASAQLDVSANNRGILVPRVSIGNVFLASPVVSPAEGLLVWNTNASVTNGQGVGFYYWTGSRWQKLTNISEGWSLTGNSVDTAVHFIGTTSNNGLMFRVGNQKAGGIFPFGGNTFLGAKAGRFLKLDSETFSGENNTFIGSDAGESQLTGRANTFVGARAGVNSQTGFGNTAIGYQAGAGNGGGNSNTAIGIGAGGSASGSGNVSIGASSGSTLGNGYENVMIGYDVGSFLFDESNAPAYGNVWIGSKAATGNFGLFPKLQSINNVIIGDSAATKVNGAIANVFVGKRSGMNSVNGQFNVFMGDSSGINNTGGQRNTYVGSKARGNSALRVNATAIGANAEAGADNVVVLGSINGINGATSSANVGIGTTTPGAKLHVVNGTSTGVNFSGNSSLVLDRAGGSNHLSMLVDGTSEAALIFGKAGSAQPPFDGGIFYNTGGAGAMQFRNAAGLTRMIIHNNGNISMGSTSNAYKLLVQSGTATGISASSNSTLVIDKAGAPNYISLLGDNTNETGLLFGRLGESVANANGAIIYNSVNVRSGFQFRTGGNTNRMVIDDGGNIGMGTNTPEYKLHLVTNLSANNGYLGGLMIQNTNTTNPEAAISFKNAGSNGTGTNQWIIGLNANRNFSFSYGAQFLDANTRMVLDSTGRLGLGVLTPGFQLHLSQNSAAKPSSSSWTVSSDERLKKDIHPFKDGLEVLKKIDPIWFTYTGAENHPQQEAVGTTAQAMQKIAPYMVTLLKEKSTVGDNLLGVDYGPLQFIMVNAIKEQQAVIERQEEIIIRQQKQLAAMDKRLSQLESVLKK